MGKLERDLATLMDRLPEPKRRPSAADMARYEAGEIVSFSMDDAPLDRAIWAWNDEHGYEAKVLWVAGEWQVLDFKGEPTRVGFYPTHWCPSKVKIFRQPDTREEWELTRDMTL